MAGTAVAFTALQAPVRRQAGRRRTRASASRHGHVTTAASVVEAEAQAAELNGTHCIPGSVSFAAGPGGLVKAVLTHQNGTSAEVHLHGATVTSFAQSSGDEVLFVRPDAVFDGSKPIAGGVPICFPRFGPSPEMQQHGFARNVAWEVLRTSADLRPDDPEPCVQLRLTDSDYTRSMWPHSFEALYEVTLRRDKLRLVLQVKNCNADKALEFTCALHTYLEVVDAALPAVQVTGLRGCTYLDKVPDPKVPVRKVESSEAVRFGGGLVDRMYLDTPAEVILEVGTGAGVAVEHVSGFEDHVLWNPHTTLPDCWTSFVCVESAKTRAQTLEPGYVWEAEANLVVLDLPA